MFTGIIEEVGQVHSLQQVNQHHILRVICTKVLESTQLGDSIAVNGVCLTVKALHVDGISFGLGFETLERSSFGSNIPPQKVNLERAMIANGRFGGHFVQGHVDGIGTLQAYQQKGDSLHMTIGAPPKMLRYVVSKGFIAIDGISLTVIDVTSDAFTLMLVDYTRHHVVLGTLSVGAPVNLEVDILAKYVENFQKPPC